MSIHLQYSACTHTKETLFLQTYICWYTVCSVYICSILSRVQVLQMQLASTILVSYSSCSRNISTLLHTLSVRLQQIDTHDVSVWCPACTLSWTLSSHLNTYTCVFLSWVPVAAWVESAQVWLAFTEFTPLFCDVSGWRCIGPQLELALLHPPDHHRFFFCPEPCAGSPLWVSSFFHPSASSFLTDVLHCPLITIKEIIKIYVRLTSLFAKLKLSPGPRCPLHLYNCLHWSRLNMRSVNRKL